jgi:hypothetical protein
MNRFTSVLALQAVAVAAGVAFASTAFAEAPRPGVVGQIVRIQAGGGAVTLTHKGGQRINAQPYQLLYTGDVIQVTAPAGVAMVEFAGADGGQVKITHATGAYRVVARSGGNADPQTWARFVQKWGYVLSPPSSERIESTTPRSVGIPTGGLAASHYLPLIRQTVSARGRHIFPVVWQGQPAAVTLVDGTGAVVAKAAASQAGFALVHCDNALKPGDYRLEIGEQPTGPLVIMISVADTPGSAPSTHEEGALRAADALDGAPGGRLQALSELQALAEKSYLASAVMKAVQAGE